MTAREAGYDYNELYNSTSAVRDCFQHLSEEDRYILDCMGFDAYTQVADLTATEESLTGIYQEMKEVLTREGNC